MCRMLLPTAAAFFTALEADNSREFWRAQRTVYDDALRPAFLALLPDAPAGWRVYRPHNDTRFGRTAPYKTFLGAVTERADGVGWFVRVDARGLLVGSGIPMPARDQLARWREAVGGPDGAAFVAAADRVAATGARVHPGRYDPLARVPRGWPADHPRAEWLRWKGVEVTTRLGVSDDPLDADAVRALLDRGEPVHGWLAAHVGPSALSAEERFAPRTAARAR